MLFVFFVSNASASELAYGQVTSDTTITGASDGSETDVVSSGAVTYAANKVRIEFYSYAVIPAGGSAPVLCTLWDGSTQLGRMSWTASTAVVDAVRYLTPSAGSHTYKIKCWRVTTNGTVSAGAGGSSGASPPAFIRVSDDPSVGSSTLSSLSDVNLSSPTNGQTLTYNTSTSKWVNTTPIAGASALHDLTDVNDTGKIDGSVLKYNPASSKWIVGTDSLGSGGGGLSADDSHRLDLAWWGIWAEVGLIFILIMAPRWYRAFDVTRGF
jgi:hypothetical protein